MDYKNNSSNLILELRRAKKYIKRPLKDIEIIQIIKLNRQSRPKHEYLINQHFKKITQFKKEYNEEFNDYSTNQIQTKKINVNNKVEGFENEITDIVSFRDFANKNKYITKYIVGDTNYRQEYTAQNIDKLFGINDLFYIQRKLATHAQYQYAYILLDTNNIAQELSDGSKFTWKITNFISLEQGVVSCANNIRDLVGMRIFPFKADLLTPLNENGKIYYNNVVNVNNNFTVLIEEFKAQSFIGRDGRKFHFVLFPAIMNLLPQEYGRPITPTNPYIEYTTSGKGNGWFWFRTPITEFSTLTITMGNPFDLVKLNNNVRTLIPLQFIYLAEK